MGRPEFTLTLGAGARIIALPPSVRTSRAPVPSGAVR